MPYKSEAQRRYMHAAKPEGVDLSEWDAASKGKKLPERIGKKSKKKRNSTKDVAQSTKAASAGTFDHLAISPKLIVASQSLSKAASVVRQIATQSEGVSIESNAVSQYDRLDKTALFCKSSDLMSAMNGASAPAAPSSSGAVLSSPIAPHTPTALLAQSQAQAAGMQTNSVGVPMQAPLSPMAAVDAFHGATGGLGPNAQAMPGTSDLHTGPLGQGPGTTKGFGAGNVGSTEQGTLGGMKIGSLDKYSALQDLQLGDLVIKDRGDLGADIHGSDGEKTSFLTQGGELGFMDWLERKYPQGRKGPGIFSTHKTAAENCLQEQNCDGYSEVDEPDAMKLDESSDPDYSNLESSQYPVFGEDALEGLSTYLSSKAKSIPTEPKQPNPGSPGNLHCKKAALSLPSPNKVPGFQDFKPAIGAGAAPKPLQTATPPLAGVGSAGKAGPGLATPPKPALPTGPAVPPIRPSLHHRTSGNLVAGVAPSGLPGLSKSMTVPAPVNPADPAGELQAGMPSVARPARVPTVLPAAPSAAAPPTRTTAPPAEATVVDAPQNRFWQQIQRLQDANTRMEGDTSVDPRRSTSAEYQAQQRGNRVQSNKERISKLQREGAISSKADTKTRAAQYAAEGFSPEAVANWQKRVKMFRSGKDPKAFGEGMSDESRRLSTAHLRQRKPEDV